LVFFISPQLYWFLRSIRARVSWSLL
jgi:hypothetical protein